MANDVRGATLIGQDWGGLIGLRMAAEDPDRFEAIVAANTGLPLVVDLPEDRLRAVREFLSPATPTPTMQEMAAALASIDPEARERKFAYWQKWTWETEDLPIGMIVGMSVAGGGGATLTPEEVAAYDAPFPDASYKMGPRAMPTQVPLLPDAPCVAEQAAAGKVFREWQKPFLCAFTDNDPSPAVAVRCSGSASRAPQDNPTRESRGAATLSRKGATKCLRASCPISSAPLDGGWHREAQDIS